MKFKIVDEYRDESYVPTEPVSLSDAKAWCLVDYTDDDNLLLSLITQSRKAIENYCNISICPKTISLTVQYQPPWLNQNNPQIYNYNYRWDANFFGWPLPNDWSELPYGPVASVQSVTQINNDGTTLILNNFKDYYITGIQFKQIRFLSWADQILIIYFTPYYCPDALKEAILNEIAFRYENRGAGLNRYASQNVGASEGAAFLADPYKRIWL